MNFNAIVLGTAVGDSLGLPAENLSPQRIKKLWPMGWKQRFLLGKGMISDDTEHTLFVAVSLLQEDQDEERFGRILSWKLRWWLFGIPAGIGLATLRACFKLWIGFPYYSSGVFSAGNGTAMRSALIGAYFFDDAEKRKAFVRVSSRITHTDPKAEIGALAIAEAVAWSACQSDRDFSNISSLFERFRELPPQEDEEWEKIVEQIEKSLKDNHEVWEFVHQLGLKKGVTGYIYHTVPVAVYSWILNKANPQKTIEDVLDCGGDTDTVGAIAGALAGASCDQLEEELSGFVDNIWEWPRTMGFMKEVSHQLILKKNKKKISIPHYFWPGVFFRNILFFIVVLIHGMRRLLPPY